MSEYTESLTKTIAFLKTKSNLGVKHTTHVPEEFDSPTRVRHYNTVSYLISELLHTSTAIKPGIGKVEGCHRVFTMAPLLV